MVYLITYDLVKPGQDYDGLISKIKTLGNWWHYLKSTWLVDTNLNAKQIYEQLKANLDSSDNILIIKVTRDYWGYLPDGDDSWSWIETRI